MRRSSIYTFLLLLIPASFIACETTSSPSDDVDSEPIISRFDITPQVLNFSSIDDGIKDTTVIVHFEANVSNLTDSHPLLTIIDDANQQILAQEKMLMSFSSPSYVVDIPIQTRTTYFNEYRVNLLATTSSGASTYALATLSFNGFSDFAPQILSVVNPDTVVRPVTETDLYAFTAKVRDADGQDTIEGVFLRIFHPESGEVMNSPFRLYDDGDNGNDVTAADSIYTITFPVEPGSQSQTFDLWYHAIDKGGLSSDTVQTQFTIVD